MDWPSLGREDLELATSDEVCEMFSTVPEDDDFLVLPTAWECCFESCDELLGEGTFGRISKVLDSLTGQYFAVKVVNRGAMPESQQLENEVCATMGVSSLVAWLSCQLLFCCCWSSGLLSCCTSTCPRLSLSHSTCRFWGVLGSVLWASSVSLC